MFVGARRAVAEGGDVQRAVGRERQRRGPLDGGDLHGAARLAAVDLGGVDAVDAAGLRIGSGEVDGVEVAAAGCRPGRRRRSRPVCEVEGRARRSSGRRTSIGCRARRASPIWPTTR